MRLVITTNSGAGGGQVGRVPGHRRARARTRPDRHRLTASPAAPVETDPITLSATVKNIGTNASPATNVNLYLGTTKVGTAAVGALAAGASTTVSANIGAKNAASYQLTAKVDEANAVVEQNETNNSYTNPTALVVKPVDSSDLVASPVAWSPGNPSAGNTVNFIGGDQEPGHGRLGERLARHHADRSPTPPAAAWSRRSPAPTAARSRPGPPPARSAWAAGRRSTATTPSRR